MKAVLCLIGLLAVASAGPKNIKECTSATAPTKCDPGFYLKGDPKVCTACVPAANDDLCKAHATDKVVKTAAELCPLGTETATPAVADAAGACKACAAGKFANAAATAGCGDCAANCLACTSATVCTNAAAGYFLNSGVPAACTPAANDDLCKADATLKVVKTAEDLCVASNTLTASPAVADAAGACKNCAAGKFANAAATAGCGDCAQGAIATCDADATKKVLKTAAELCPTGTDTATPAVADAAAACTTCAAGKFPNAAATTGCADCDPQAKCSSMKDDAAFCGDKVYDDTKADTLCDAAACTKDADAAKCCKDKPAPQSGASQASLSLAAVAAVIAVFH